MILARHATPPLDQLIEGITVDCHGEDEQLMGFESASDEHPGFPCPGTVVGEDAEVFRVGRGGGRRELIATCQIAAERDEIALLDVDIHADPGTARLFATHRPWTALAAA